MNFHPLPQPNDIPSREREDAMGAYLMMFAAFAVGLPLPIVNLIAAIVYYYVNRKKSRFVHFHCLQSLLSQIPTTLLNWGALAWFLYIFFNHMEVTQIFWAYLIFALVCSIIYFIYSIIAAVKARKGRMYYFIFFGTIAYEVAYKVRKEEVTQEIVNKPPF